MPDYCWEEHPYNSRTTVILVWCSKEVKELFFNFQKVKLLYRETFFKFTIILVFLFLQVDVLKRLLIFEQMVKDTNDVSFLQSYIL